MKSTGRTWITCEITEDGEESFVLNFCKVFMEDMGWKEGDELEWTPTEDGEGWIIKKMDEQADYGDSFVTLIERPDTKSLQP